jgi:hypothetical protein
VTDVAIAAVQPHLGRPRAAPTIVAGLVLGAVVGVTARAWMRLVSSDPELSWSGTILIVVVFALAGFGQGLALAVRQRRWTWWHQFPVRIVAGFGALLLGGGAGIVMLPAIVGGSLAVARHDWGRGARRVAGGVAVVNALAMWWLLGSELAILPRAVGWLAMLPLYAAIIGGVSLNLRPLAGGPRRSRTLALGAAVAGVLASGVLVLSMVGA